MTDQKPLFFTPDPSMGFTVERREDGGMNLTFKEVTSETMGHWHRFAEEHLIGSDRLVRNLYDLRQVDHISDRAIQIAVELNSDPLARNIRLAVLVKDEKIANAIQRISDLTQVGGAHLKIFADIDAAENWLNRPMDSMV